jgi:hypothetical protein
MVKRHDTPSTPNNACFTQNQMQGANQKFKIKTHSSSLDDFVSTKMQIIGIVLEVSLFLPFSLRCSSSRGKVDYQICVTKIIATHTQVQARGSLIHACLFVVLSIALSYAQSSQAL